MPVTPVIFEGPNRAGKTTLIDGLRGTPGYMSGWPTLKLPTPKTPREALELHWSVMHQIRQINRTGGTGMVYIDRLPFPSDIVYREAMHLEPSVDIRKHQTAIIDTFEELNCLFVYVTTSVEELVRRLRETGEHHHIGTSEDILERVHDGYETFFGGELQLLYPEAKFFKVVTEPGKKLESLPSIIDFIEGNRK